MLICFYELQYSSISFFFNDPATTEIYTLSLHDALPIFLEVVGFIDDEHVAFGQDAAAADQIRQQQRVVGNDHMTLLGDRKSTRLNSSHTVISYAVFCLKKKKKQKHKYKPQQDLKSKTST